MKYCRKEDDAFYHTVITNINTKTNTKTKTKTGTKKKTKSGARNMGGNIRCHFPLYSHQSLLSELPSLSLLIHSWVSVNTGIPSGRGDVSNVICRSVFVCSNSVFSSGFWSEKNFLVCCGSWCVMASSVLVDYFLSLVHSLVEALIRQGDVPTCLW